MEQYDKAAPARVNYDDWNNMESSAKQAHARAVVVAENAKKERFRETIERYNKMSSQEQRLARRQVMGDEEKAITYREWSARVDRLSMDHEKPEVPQAYKKPNPFGKDEIVEAQTGKASKKGKGGRKQ
jgi:hypothetical protein